MRISINLATKPFVELRPLFAKLRLAMVVLVVAAIGLTVWSRSLDLRAERASAQMNQLKAQTAAAENERSRNEARMRQPQNKAVLDRSMFLNQLFALKSFSWTATMMDLEKVLPSGVQVTSIEPVITKEGDVNLRLRVSGDRDRAIQLVRNLETSHRFTGARLAGESAMTMDKAKAIGQVRDVSATGGQPLGNGVEFEIFSGYNPLPLPAARAADTAAVRTAAEMKKMAASPRKRSADVTPGSARPGGTR